MNGEQGPAKQVTKILCRVKAGHEFVLKTTVFKGQVYRNSKISPSRSHLRIRWSRFATDCTKSTQMVEKGFDRPVESAPKTTCIKLSIPHPSPHEPFFSYFVRKALLSVTRHSLNLCSKRSFKLITHSLFTIRKLAS